MRPPICAVCRERLAEGDAGGLVHFARDDGDAAYYERAKQPGFSGHPPHLEWFCGAHVAAARELVSLTRGEALARLRK